MSELYTIDKPPQTDLEKFQALRIEALENRNKYLEEKLVEAKELLNGIVADANNVSVVDAKIISDYKDFSA